MLHIVLCSPFPLLTPTLTPTPSQSPPTLAKAVCSLFPSTFFNLTSSSLISKYRGESEKIVRAVFSMARILAPSVVFIDEVDALVSTRGGVSWHVHTYIKAIMYTWCIRICTARAYTYANTEHKHIHTLTMYARIHVQMHTQLGSGSAGEHEASRRMKTELFMQMDGLVGSNDGEKVS
ncbi:AAA family ATPase [archaeon]|nr:MAG: AAA family ATPase [archaeon]